MLCGKKHWQGLKGEICFYCLLMRAFDVALLFAVCTPGSLGLHSDELSAGEGEAGGGAIRHIPGNTFQSAAAALPGVGRQ